MGMIDKIGWYAIRRRSLNKNKNVLTNLFSFIDKKSILHGENKIGKGCEILDSEIGMFTYIVSARISHTKIGAFCSIGSGVKIGGLGTHPIDYISTHPIFYSTKKQCGVTFTSKDQFPEIKETIIGNDVWIGVNATILDGLQIGNGAVIAAGAVVVKDVKPYSIVGGVPAKEIKKRFDQATINILEQINWWNLPVELIKELAPNFCTNKDINEAIQNLIRLSKKFYSER